MDHLNAEPLTTPPVNCHSKTPGCNAAPYSPPPQRVMQPTDLYPPPTPAQWRLARVAVFQGIGLAPLTQLTYLRLYGTSVSGDVSGLAPLTQLTALGLRDTGVGDDFSAVCGEGCVCYGC